MGDVSWQRSNTKRIKTGIMTGKQCSINSWGKKKKKKGCYDPYTHREGNSITAAAGYGWVSSCLLTSQAPSSNWPGAFVLSVPMRKVAVKAVNHWTMIWLSGEHWGMNSAGKSIAQPGCQHPKHHVMSLQAVQRGHTCPTPPRFKLLNVFSLMKGPLWRKIIIKSNVER